MHVRGVRGVADKDTDAGLGGARRREQKPHERAYQTVEARGQRCCRRDCS
jgi:hypothetical protein